MKEPRINQWNSLRPTGRAVRPRRGVGLLVFLFMLPAGCETEKQQRFHQYSDEGIRLYKNGDFVSAREHFEIALPLEPKDANLHYNLGQCCDRLGQASQAENYYKQCLELNTNHPECRHALAVLLYRSGRRVEADEMIQNWLANQPDLAAAYAEDGWRARQSGQYQLAIGRFQQALHLEARNQRALVELGQLYEEHQQPALALTMYTRALEVNPQQSELKDHINQLKANGVGRPMPD
jgi:Flp pilus assembly protein TadD